MIRASQALRDGGLVAAVALPPMVLAASRDLDWFDGPELALAAVQRGVAHPPGAPLHTLVGHLFAQVLPDYFGVALASALPGCASAVPAMVIADALRAPDDTRRARALRALPILAALLCPPVFETATRVEVYSLGGLGVLAALALALHARAFAAGLALGLTFCVNPVFAAAAALGVAVALLPQRPWRTLPRAFAGGLLGLLPYAHLPWVGGDPARFAWGAPATPRAFLAVLRAADFARNVEVGAARTATNARVLASMLAPAAGCVALCGAAALLAWRRRRAGSLAPAAAAAALSATLLANAGLAFNPDLHGYLAPAALLGGASLASLVAHAAGRGARVLTAVAALPVVALALELPLIAARQRGPSAARSLCAAALDAAPRDAIVLLRSDHLVFSALYLQEVERRRPDLVIVNLGFGSSQWYWAHLARIHPGLRVVLAPGVGRTERLRRFLQANPQRPVVAEATEVLAAVHRPACEGTFLVGATAACAPPDLARRAAQIEAAARVVAGDWIGQRVVISYAANLAVESRIRGAPARAARTLAAADPTLAPFATLLPAAPDDPAQARPPIPLPSNTALLGPDDLRYRLGRTLLEAGAPAGFALLAEAAAAGVAQAESDLARARP